jgi:hypothetical protein
MYAGTDGTNGACNHPQMGKLMRSLATDICFVFFGSVSVPNANNIISLIIPPSLLFYFIYFFQSFIVLPGCFLIIALIGMISFLYRSRLLRK